MTLYPFYRTLGAPHVQSAVADRLLYAPWKSEWTEFRNAWKTNWTDDVISTVRNPVYIFRSICYSISVHQPESVPFDFHIFWRFCQYLLRYSDCHLFRHPQNWRCSSASRHESPVFLTTFTVHFQTFAANISLLTPAFQLVTICDTTTDNWQLQQNTFWSLLTLRQSVRYNCTFGSRTHKVFTDVPYKTGSKSVTGCTVLQWKTGTDCTAEFCM